MGYDGLQADFANYGGIIRIWGVPVGGQRLLYGFGPITTDQADLQRASAIVEGATMATEGSYDVYTFLNKDRAQMNREIGLSETTSGHMSTTLTPA